MAQGAAMPAASAAAARAPPPPAAGAAQGPAAARTEKCARKKQTSVACPAPIRRQGFGHVIPRRPYGVFI